MRPGCKKEIWYRGIARKSIATAHDKREAISIATDFHYGDDIINEIRMAITVDQISSAMKKGRCRL